MYSQGPGPYGYPPGGFVDPERQKSEGRVKTLAILQLVFGGLGVFGLVNTAIQSQTASDPISRKIYKAMWEGSLGTWMMISTAIGAILVLLLLAAGWSMLKRRAIGRTLTLAHAVSAVVINSVSSVVSFVLMGPVIREMSQALGPGAEIFATTMRGAMFMGALFGIAFPAAEWYLVTRPGVREVLDG